jgi:16S rRNA (cytosine1402-N4)-methyltransferase
MTDEVIEHLDIRSDGVYFDGTVGTGGHARAILDAGARGEDRTRGCLLVGVDRDPDAVLEAQSRLDMFGDRARIRHAEYGDIEKILEAEGVDAVDGILLDLGIGSHQLESDDRGFSLERGGPLDMRYDPTDRVTAFEVVNRYPKRELEEIIREYGEERRARSVAGAIVSARGRGTIDNAENLAGIVRAAVTRGGTSKRGRIDPATRTFQALRIFVNRELERVEEFIPRGAACLKEHGRMAIISYHSLEDRIVKFSFRGLAADAHDAGMEGTEGRGYRILTKKPLVPTIREQRENPRSRSAKMRLLMRTNNGH